MVASHGTVGSDVKLMSPLTPIGSLALWLLANLTGALECDKEKVCPITFQVVFDFAAAFFGLFDVAWL